MGGMWVRGAAAPHWVWRGVSWGETAPRLVAWCCGELWVSHREPWASVRDAFACGERQNLALGLSLPLVGSGSTELTHRAGGKCGMLRDFTALPEVVAGCSPDTAYTSKRAARRGDG